MGVAALCITSAKAQTNLNFNAVSATIEGAIRLSWNSLPGETYEIDEADSLIDTNTGSITWNVLYRDYPSQGTNTFWLDTGNYFADPVIPHPKRTQVRFYRIADLGHDTASNAPVVSISSPTGGDVAVGELSVVVSAATDQAEINTKLFVDGEEMFPSIYTTNYLNGSTNFITQTYAVNTCEWGNGPHVIFATAQTRSIPIGQNTQPLIGHGVSAMLPITFSNLITRVSFSEYFFEPEQGQTQHVSAVFAANCDWTLDVIDVDSNTVRQASGSGVSLSFDWDGRDSNSNVVPAGVYHYFTSAETNGGPFGPMLSASAFSGSGLAATSPSMDEFDILWAMPGDGSGDAAPLVLYPPGTDTNGFFVFEAPWADVFPRRASLSMSATAEGSGAGGLDAAAYGGAAGQGTLTPQRPGTVPASGVAGTVGIGYQQYLAWTNAYAPASPDDGLHINHRIGMQGTNGTNPIEYHPLTSLVKEEAQWFVSVLGNWAGWKNTLIKADDNLKIADLRGSSTPFNQVNLGVLLTHGTYGTSIDYAANQCKQMYFPIASGSGATYLRMSEMNFGGAGTNGLKWMALMSCFSLYHVNWQSMQTAQIKPYNSNLHLLLGCDTTEYIDDNILAYWARYMAGGYNPTGTNLTTLPIRSAWYQAAHDAYYYRIFPDGSAPLVFAVAGDVNCSNDKLRTNRTPTGSWFYETNIVWRPPQ
jgi:hypothetical protein